ncbi:MAG: hypothetical protein HY021_00865, partial [Burkholderiales bacterium]|nr:hypothetical protein [Burkholderiales bacterium]
MSSRLLAQLETQVRESTDPISWARALCRMASQFARQGQTSDAVEAITQVRAKFGHSLNAEVGSWLMLTEGILHFFKDESAEAYDRMRRAYGIASALGSPASLPTCAAWMAHIEFNQNRFAAAARYLAEAIRLAESDDHQARGRAALMATSNSPTCGHSNSPGQDGADYGLSCPVGVE